MATKAEREAAAQRAEEERLRGEKERAQGSADLAAHNAAQSALSDKERAAAEEKAREEAERVAKEEAARAAAEQEEAARLAAEIEREASRLAAEAKADEEDGAGKEDVARLPGLRILKAGTKFRLNGDEVVAPVDLPMILQNGESEQHFASLLARDPENFRLNEGLLRLQYNPMNGTPLPLEAQRLRPEDMTPSERALFNIKD